MPPASPSSVAVFLALALAAGLSSCASPGNRPASSPPDKESTVFEASVKPLFEQRCVACHRDELSHGGLNLQDRAGTLDPARRFLVPGKPGASTIYRALTLDAAHPKVMPGDGWGISEAQVEAVRAWIEAGAPWPEGRSGSIERKRLRVERDDFL